LDDERLVYNVLDRNKLTPLRFPVAVINPFSGEVQEIASDYPGNSSPWGTEMKFIYSDVVYDPTLNLAIYPEVNADGSFVTLWDRNSQTAVARLEELGIFYHNPIWLPGGKQFVISVTHSATRRDDIDGWYLRDEWFSIDRTGEINQLTHFGDHFTEADIEGASISPNGRYLAFWLAVNPSPYPGSNLAVLDLETRQVINYCVPGSPAKFPLEPVWSPDSRYIALVDYYDRKSSDSHVILVNPTEGWAAQIADNLTADGWMVTSP
jgi:hypothetical protein